MSEVHMRKSWIKRIGPGILIAATGVGAGDLSAGAFVGSMYGVVLLWAVVVGAVLKFALNEGLARWQLATGKTILEGCFEQFGMIFGVMFLLYLFIWTFLTAAALMSACGVVTHAIWPVFSEAATNKIFWGISHSLVAIGLIWWGGYRIFERVMSVCIAIMFVTVTCTAIMSGPDVTEILTGLFWPRIPDWNGQGIPWTMALLGGVGGTLTVVCYGYWIREEGRETVDDLSLCRLDLATGYFMTALFGMAMLILGSQTELPPGSSATTVVRLSDQLQLIMGDYGVLARWLFLLGAWGAVASSLLGVWQCIPYLFADVLELMSARWQSRKRKPLQTNSLSYRGYLIGMGLIPMLGLLSDFKTVLKYTAVCGSLVIPLLAVVLLILGSQQKLIGWKYRNPLWSTGLLILGLLFFVFAISLQLKVS